MKIVLTGGGTAGHVMPHIALLPAMRAKGWEICYIGSQGMERDLIRDQGVPFVTIAVGKLRRYFSWQNFKDVFKVFLGIYQAWRFLSRYRPNVIFSKGGFVSVPVAIAGRMLGIPVVSHESDLTPGLANRIIGRFADALLYSFPETKRFLPVDRSHLVGLPIRPELAQGRREIGLQLTGFSGEKSVVLIMGGSSGSVLINQAIEAEVKTLCQSYHLIHITGKGKMTQVNNPDYWQREFVSDELPHLLRLADMVVCRAGANSLFEMLALEKPMLLIPLRQGSRGDQVDNAKSFVAQNWAMMLEESHLADDGGLMAALEELWREREAMQSSQRAAARGNDPEGVLGILESLGCGKEA